MRYAFDALCGIESEVLVIVASAAGAVPTSAYTTSTWFAREGIGFTESQVRKEAPTSTFVEKRAPDGSVLMAGNDVYNPGYGGAAVTTPESYSFFRNGRVFAYLTRAGL